MAIPRPQGITPAAWAVRLYDDFPLVYDNEVDEWRGYLAARGYASAPDQATRDQAIADAQDDMRVSRFKDVRGDGRRPLAELLVLLALRADTRWRALIVKRALEALT